MHSSKLFRLVFLGLGLAAFSAPAFTARDANTIFTAFNSSFYIQSGTSGYFKNTQTDNSPTYFWGQAEMMECVIDTYEWNTNATARVMMTNLCNGFIANNGSTWTGDGYNDDILWAVIAFARTGQDVGNANFCLIAKNNFDAVYARGWDTNLGGGLYWQYPENAGKNACVNGPGAIAAYLLYQIYGDTNYLAKSLAIYNWERAVLFNTNSGAIYDSISTNGAINTWSSTYNQGTFLGAANFLGQTNDAMLAANFTMMDMSGGGILPVYPIANNNSGFNAIFLRWMTRFMKSRNLQPLYEPWLQTNAAVAWTGRRLADNLSWCEWPGASPVGTNFYAWDCISSYAALQAAAPTQGSSPGAVATDYVGYWPLDATNGSTTADLSAAGNNGVVTGAGWSASGRVNGCLVFNGTSSSVQITNPVCNDFTIAFWVKTTQTAGTGQWYNGVGLVDGDYPMTANDFGTAMCGGKFAFGIGNPDTTILSTTSINDGAWHQCVATRTQTTGAFSVYVDGTLQATGKAGQNTQNASAKLLFGEIASGGSHYFNGSLDEVQIFSRALSSSEVAALYGCIVSPPPAAPTNLLAAAGNAQVQLSWAAAADATSYNVKRSSLSGGPYTLLTNVATAAYADTNVVNNRTYFYVVSAVNTNGESTNSSPVSANTLALVAWFKADAITGVASGAPLSVWPDATGNGYNAWQTTSTNQPTYVAGALNGLPVVRFNTTNSSYLWFYRPVQDDFTIILVYQSSQGIGTGTSYWQGAGLVNGEVSGTVPDFGMSLNASGQILAGTGEPDTTLVSTGAHNNGRPYVVTFKRTKASGLIQLYVNSVLLASAIAGTESLTAPNFLVLGAQAPLDNFLNGDIAEVQIYNSALTDTDRTGQERALDCKYGFTSSATPAAPVILTTLAGNRQIALDWSLIAGAAGYNLWRSTNGGASYQAVATGLTGGSFVDTNAANGQTNYYTVTASDDCGAGSYSTAAAVDLPLPALGLNAGAGALGLNWPGWADDWVLYSATNLTPPVVWTPVTNAVGSNGGQFNVSVPLAAPAQYFRLTPP
jgi:hypothetical protein